MSFLLSPFRAAYETAKNHKKKIAGATAITLCVGGYFAYHKLKPVISQLQLFWKELKSLETMQQQQQEQEKLRLAQFLWNKFESNMTVSHITLCDVSVRIREELIILFPVETLRTQLNGVTGQEQAERWERFKVACVGRTMAASYGICLLNVMLKIQMSIVSRHLHQQPQEQKSMDMALDLFQRSQTNNNKSYDFTKMREDIRTRFLRLSEHLQKEGLKKLSNRLSRHIELVLKDWPVKRVCSSSEWQTLVTQIRDLFEIKYQEETNEDGYDNKHKESYLDYLLPSEEEIQTQYKKLLEETQEILIKDLDFQRKIEDNEIQQLLELKKNPERLLSPSSSSSTSSSSLASSSSSSTVTPGGDNEITEIDLSNPSNSSSNSSVVASSVGSNSGSSGGNSNNREKEIQKKTEEIEQRITLILQTRQKREHDASVEHKKVIGIFQEMINETKEIGSCPSFNYLVNETFTQAFDLMFQLIQDNWDKKTTTDSPSSSPSSLSSETKVPLVQLVVRLPKVFSVFFPTEDQQRSSPLLALLANCESVKEFSSLIFYPMEVNKLLEGMKKNRTKNYSELQRIDPALLDSNSSALQPFSGFPGFGGLGGGGDGELPDPALMQQFLATLGGGGLSGGSIGWDNKNNS